VISLYLKQICHFSFAIKSQKSKTKKRRGIRKPRGYKPESFWKNYHLAINEYIPGPPVSQEASTFWHDCKTYADLIQMSIKCDGEKFSVHCAGPNKPLLSYYKMPVSELPKIAENLAQTFCERILWAIENKNGFFFKDLARFCETPIPKDINLRTWLLILHRMLWQDLKQGQTPEKYYIPRELRKKAIARGVTTEHQTERYLRQVCSDFAQRYCPAFTSLPQVAQQFAARHSLRFCFCHLAWRVADGFSGCILGGLQILGFISPRFKPAK
jgi:hypothetical protein